MEKRINKSYKKTLLDRPVPNKKVKISLRGNKPKLEIIKLLPLPIKPTKPKSKKKPIIKLKIKPKTSLPKKECDYN